MMKLENPVGWVLLGSVLVILAVWWLYRKTDTTLPRWLKPLLSGLRLLVMLWVLVLVARPFLEQRKTRLEQPRLVILQDRSASAADSARAVTDRLLRQIGDAVPVDVLPFANGIIDAAPDSVVYRETDIDAGIRELNRRYRPEQLIGAVLVSDGIFTTGQNPVFTASALPFPLHTVGVGDTSRYPDARIDDIRFNRVVYRNRQFPLEVDWSLRDMNAEKASLILTKGEEVLEKVNLFRDGPKTQGTHLFLTEAAETGMHQYRIAIQVDQPEKNSLNNRRMALVEVMDQQARIAVVYDAPHPDVGAVVGALDQLDVYDLQVMQQSDYHPDDSFDLLLYLRRGRGTKPIDPGQRPFWYFSGKNRGEGSASAWWNGVQASLNAGPMNEVYPVLNRSFGLFNLSEKWGDLPVTDLPPLTAPLGRFFVTPGTEVLLYQELAGMKTNAPMLVLQENADGKAGLWIGENLWRWRMAVNDFSDAPLFDELVQLVTQYLLVKERDQLLEITVPEDIRAGREAIWKATLLNEALEPVGDADITLNLTRRSDGLEFVLSFQPAAVGYSLRKALPAGEYDYMATARWNDRTFTTRGVAVVSDFNPEQVRTRADFPLLREMAAVTGGGFHVSNPVSGVVKGWLNVSRARPVGYTSIEKAYWVELKWMFFAIALLIAMEWALRKRFGMK